MLLEIIHGPAFHQIDIKPRELERLAAHIDMVCHALARRPLFNSLTLYNTGETSEACCKSNRICRDRLYRLAWWSNPLSPDGGIKGNGEIRI